VAREFLPSPGQTVAIADRLVDDATIPPSTGTPYRQARTAPRLTTTSSRDPAPPAGAPAGPPAGGLSARRPRAGRQSPHLCTG